MFELKKKNELLEFVYDKEKHTLTACVLNLYFTALLKSKNYNIEDTKALIKTSNLWDIILTSLPRISVEKELPFVALILLEQNKEIKQDEKYLQALHICVEAINKFHFEGGIYDLQQ